MDYIIIQAGGKGTRLSIRLSLIRILQIKSCRVLLKDAIRRLHR